MTKKDYIKFAEVLAQRYEDMSSDQYTVDVIRKRLEEIFIEDNPNFNTQKFTDYINKRIKEIKYVKSSISN